MGANAKQRSVELWTRDPCGPTTTAKPGSQEYFSELRDGRAAYSPWMGQILDYPAARRLAVLDIGCGQGIDLYRYAEEAAHVTGVDLTPRHVELARQHLASGGFEGTVVVGDAERLPFPDRQFDIVSSNGALHHTPDMMGALREALRVLRPAGRAKVIVYNRGSAHFWIQQLLIRGVLKGMLLRRQPLLEQVERSSGDAHPLVCVYGRGQLRRMMTRAGFRDVRTTVSPWKRSETSLHVGLPWFGWYIAATGERRA